MTLFEQIKKADIQQLAEILSQFAHDAEPTKNECLALLRSEAWSVENEEDSKSFQLKPCPFCGGNAYFAYEMLTLYERRSVPFSDGWSYWVECDECSATTEHFMSEEEAAKAWNRRIND